MKTKIVFLFSFLFGLALLLADHKPGHSSGGGGGKSKGAPEIDNYGILAIVVVFVGFYLIYFFQKRRKTNNKQAVEENKN